MPDERVSDEPIAAIARLSAELADLRNQMSARVVRRPTGDIEVTIRKTPKSDTIFLQGQTLARTDYPVLWQWVQDQELTTENLFTTGDGSTTFRVPDFRGRFMIGSGQLGNDSYTMGRTGGSSTKVILPANMATHTHQVSIRDHMSSSGQTRAEVGSPTNYHGHPSTGGHTGHAHQATNVGAAAAGSTAVLWSSYSSPGANYGHHYHGNDGPEHDHFLYIPPHSVSQVAVGSNTPMDIRPPYIPVNYMMWV